MNYFNILYYFFYNSHGGIRTIVAAVGVAQAVAMIVVLNYDG